MQAIRSCNIRPASARQRGSDRRMPAALFAALREFSSLLLLVVSMSGYLGLLGWLGSL